MATIRRITTGTDIGKRHWNEDRHGCHTYDAHDRHTVGVVCDGLGGHPGGRQAAEAARNAFLKTHAALAWNHIEPGMRLNQALRNANASVGDWADGHPNLNGMCTTLTAFELDEHSVRWISVGDSVLYLWSRNTRFLLQLNTRHNDPRYNRMITSVLNGRRMPLIDIETEGRPIADGDWIIAASGGLDTLSQKQIATAAKRAARAPFGHLADMLIQQIREVGKPTQDNTSIIAVQAGRVPQMTRPAAGN